MNTWQYIKRNLLYFKWSQLSTLAGIAIGTSILTGALVVGDSVKYSLLEIGNRRLGKTVYAIRSQERVFSRTILDTIRATLDEAASGLVLGEGVAINPGNQSVVNRVQVAGVDEAFLDLWDEPYPIPGHDEVILGRNLALQLNVQPGDPVLLKVRKPENAPTNAPFVAQTSPITSLRLRVKSIAEEERMGRFSLKNEQVTPYTAFVSRSFLSEKLGIENKVNTILLVKGDQDPSFPGLLDSAFRKAWSLEDAGVLILPASGENEYELRSDRIFIDSLLCNSITHLLPRKQAFLTYFVNSFRSGNKSTPYSFISAASQEYLQFDPVEDGILINQWLADDLEVEIGDSIYLTYYSMGLMRSLRIDSCGLILKKIVDTRDRIFDRKLMPDFPGMTDAGNCREWETSAPIDLGQIRDKDEAYWNVFKGTPKAFISIDKGRKLWKNAFGEYTTFRFRADSAALIQTRKELLSQMEPAGRGYSFLPVKISAQQAAQQSTNFGELFLSLSSFIILSGLLLTVLVYKLQAGRRQKEAAILSALGFTRKQVIRIMLWEVMVVTFLGSIAGGLLGVVYNQWMIDGLNTIWQGAVSSINLEVKLVPATIEAGIAAGFLLTLCTLVLTTLKDLKVRPSQVLNRAYVMPVRKFRIRGRIGLLISLLCFGSALLILLLIAFSKSGTFEQVSMLAAGLFLVGCIAAFHETLTFFGRQETSPLPSIKRLVTRNMATRKSRTMTAVALLALGIFTIIVTGIHRKTIGQHPFAPSSGTGGFLLWAESTIPLTMDLNSEFARQKYGLGDEAVLQNLQYTQLHRLTGEDASCLNLNHVSSPSIIGIETGVFNSMKVFSFASTLPEVSESSPWMYLDQPMPVNVVPAYADMSVITWGLKKKLGDTILYRSENGQLLKLVISGGLNNSIFQGNLLVSGSLLIKHFPSTAKPNLLLINGPDRLQDSVAGRLSYLLRDYGVNPEKPAARLASFNEVENTYLFVFMMLGGLGMILGVIGLGIVLLNNTMERKKELAVYLALGISKQHVFKLLMTEYLIILLLGMSIGIVSAMLGSLQAFSQYPEEIPLGVLTSILLLIFASGFLWIYFPARTAIKARLLTSLNEEL